MNESGNEVTNESSTLVSSFDVRIAQIPIVVPIMLGRDGEYAEMHSIKLTNDEVQTLHGIVAALKLRSELCHGKPVSVPIHAIRWLIGQVRYAMDPTAKARDDEPKPQRSRNKGVKRSTKKGGKQ